MYIARKIRAIHGRTSMKQVIVITGASSGLGRCLAVEAGRRGARVGLMARRTGLLEEVKDRIVSEGGEALALSTDIRDPGSVNRAFEKMDDAWGRVDVLINNAGVVEPVAPLVKNSDEALVASLMTNVLGTYLATREAIKRMLAHFIPGTIINITSGAAQHPYIGWCMYGSQKAAVDMFTKIVAREVSEKGICVTAISPGTFESGMQEVLRNTAVEDFPERRKFVELHERGQLNRPEVVAEALMEIAFSHWPELSGVVVDLRDPDFKMECIRRGIKNGV